MPDSEVVDGERKTVTALFADIKGSMELMEDLDPEEARALVDPALKLMIDAVRRHDGYVVQSTGDGIFAIFGAPVAHEDHPLRALYSALRMQDEMRRYAERLRADKGVNLQARVGVNTGEVVVRSIKTEGSHAEYTPIGHSTGLAARLQALANPGAVVVSEGLRRQAEGYFQLRALGQARIKGVNDPIELFEVTGLGPLRTRLQVAARRGLTKFVGRQTELEQMKHALDLARQGHGQIVAAIGEPGVGKSRLFYEFKAVASSGCLVLEAYSVSHGKTSAYLPVIDLLRSYFKIAVEDDERTRCEKIAGKLVILDRALEDALPYLYSLLGTSEADDALAQFDPQTRRHRTLQAIKRILTRDSLNQPLILMFEDLHWIDSETQALLNLLADAIATARILLLVNYRPEYHHEWGNKAYYSQLRLDPLSKEGAQELLTALLGDAADLEPVKHVIIKRTEGNPFFIEEMVQALVEQGVLVRNGAVKFSKRLDQIRVPDTVQAILASRIDRLPAAEKELLQTLSVLGREFSSGLIKHVVGKSDDELERMLSPLQLAEFIYEQPAVGDIEYEFKHALTQEVAYNSVLSGRRRLLHERAGQAIESMFAGQLDDHLVALAHHYSRSDNLSKAVEYLGRAGQQALQRSTYVDALGSLNAAIDLLLKLPDNSERIQRELRLQLTAGQALIAVKGHAAPEVERAYTRARELRERVGDPPELFPALWGLWLTNFVRGEARTAYELAEQLQRRAQSTNDPALLLYAHRAMGGALCFRGDLVPAREHVERGIALYNRERHRSLVFHYGGVDAEVACLCYAALILWQLGYPDQALARVNEAFASAQALPHPFSLAFAGNWVCSLRGFRREARAVSETAERAIALPAEHGLVDFLHSSKILRGWAIAEQGREEEGIAQMQEGLVASRTRGSAFLRPYHLCLLAQACMETRRLNDGLGALSEALAIADEHENRTLEAETHRLKGELLLKKDDHISAQAQSCFERAIDVARKQNAKSWELRATTSLARLLDRLGKRAEARAMLAAIYNWFTEGFDTADLKDAKALLDETAQ
jgi:class 3 adenylate cyclase/predicted ATPase